MGKAAPNPKKHHFASTETPAGSIPGDKAEQSHRVTQTTAFPWDRSKLWHTVQL